MIIVRDIFSLKFGKAKEAKSHIKEMMELNKKLGLNNFRALVDLVGPSYTLVIEMGYDSLADFESSLKKVFSAKDFGEKYQKLIPLIDSSYREIFTVVDV